jgi:1-pyrroline-5-carboxylate dehydrogenase
MLTTTARHFLRLTAKRSMSSSAAHPLPSWATVDPSTMSGRHPAIGANLCNGRWWAPEETSSFQNIVDPLNGEVFLTVPDTNSEEVHPYIERMANAPRTGLHNPLKNPERYNMLGEVCANAAREMAKPEVQYFFSKLIQRLTPKSWPQASGEPTVVRKFLENYSCDNVRYLAKSFGVPGDRGGKNFKKCFYFCSILQMLLFVIVCCCLLLFAAVCCWWCWWCCG